MSNEKAVAYGDDGEEYEVHSFLDAEGDRVDLETDDPNLVAYVVLVIDGALNLFPVGPYTESQVH